MFNNKPKHSSIDLLEGILIGGSLVAVTTFIFGSKRGKQLQKELVHKYKMLKQEAAGIKGKIEKTLKKPVSKKLQRKAKKAISHVRKTIRTAKSTKRKKTHH